MLLRPLHAAAGLLEAPRPAPDGSVLFSNVTGGGVFRWHDGDVGTVVPDRRGIGGLAPHADGGLLMTGRDVAYTGPSGDRTVLSVDGATGCNDMTVGPDGSLYVGVLRHRPQQGEQAGPSEVLRVEPSGAVGTAAYGVFWPNGLGFAPDGETLYVSEYARGRVLAVRDGRSTVFATAPRGECDGLAVDADGGVWVALGSGDAIARFDPGGDLVELIETNCGFVSSVAFGASTIYVTTVGALLCADVDVAAQPLPRAAVPVPR